MSSVNNPVVNIKLVPDISEINLDKPRVLLVGTVPASKSTIFDAGKTTKYIKVSEAVSLEQMSNDDLANMFGTGETFHRLLMANRGSNSQVQIDALLVKNVATPTDTSTITFTGTTTGNGVIKVSVFDSFQFFATVNHKSGELAADIATEVAAQLNMPKHAPYTASAATGVVTITWLDGFVLPSTPINVKKIDSGITIVAAHVTTTTPTQPLVDLFDIIGEQRYTTILYPEYFWNTIQFPNQFLLDRFNSTNQILDGNVFCPQNGDLVNLIASTASYQGQPIVCPVGRIIDGLFDGSIGAGMTNTPDMRIAFLATAIDRTKVVGADVTDIISGADGLSDYTGGPHMVSLPYHNIPIPASMPDDPSWYFTREEQIQLNDNNLSTWGVNRAGNTDISGKILTFWKTDAIGNTNTTWTPLEHLNTSSMIRQIIDNWLRIYLGKTRMTNGDLVAGLSMVNQDSIEVFLDNRFKDLGDKGLVTSGKVALQNFRKNRTVTLTPSKQLVTVTAVYEIVTHVGNVNFTLRTTLKY